MVGKNPNGALSSGAKELPKTPLKSSTKTSKVQVTGNSHMGKPAIKPATPSNNKTGSTMGSGRNNN
ncbi:MAG: hypothetical protein QM523_03965 [Candidatus Pacebacteria bacterium]|nr:hypothetical protein [Candidatus Paceibacterota bacterium]